MKVSLALSKAWRFAAVALLTATSVACGGGNGNDQAPDPDPDPVPVISGAGNYFVSRFLVTNVSNPQEVVDGDSFGLSSYFVLGADGSVGGAGQVPNDPPAATAFSGDWEQDGNTLTVTFADGEGLVRTLTGTLSEEADGDVVFNGSQTGGAPLEVGDGDFTITTLEMQRYPADIVPADLSGEWVASNGVAFANQDNSISEDLLAGGAGLRLVFTDGGVLQVFNTFPGGGQDNFESPYTLEDNFHLSITSEGESQTLVFGLVDDQLRVYLYDTKENFENDSDSNSVPATMIYTLERI